MASNPEPTDDISVDELRALESSVLKALCLTINTAGSELKYKILDSLADDDFYFPINRALFQTLSELHRKGDYVISANLEEELKRTEHDVPENFAIDALFNGTLPGLSELNGWVTRLKERSRTGIIPTLKAPTDSGAASANDSKADATQVRSVAEVRKKIAQEQLRQSSPAVPVPKLETPPSPKPARSEPKAVAPASQPKAVAPASQPKAAAPRSEPKVAAPRSEPNAAPRSEPKVVPPKPRKPSAPSPEPPKRAAKAVLSSEGDDWNNYLDDLASKQGKTFETGFSKLDDGLGGVGPGLMLLVDEQRERLAAFMKQITDQFASKGDLRCLYVASEQPKAALRVRTLARLAGVPVSDIEKGRLKKDSAEWQRIESEGRKASRWLKRVFVYESEGELSLALARDLAKKLLDAGGDSSCIVIIDSLEKVARGGGSPQSVVSQLKKLADSLDVLVIAATTDPTLLASRDADLAGVFRDGSGGLVELEVLQAGEESSTMVTFRFEVEYSRFSEA